MACTYLVKKNTFIKYKYLIYISSIYISFVGRLRIRYGAAIISNPFECALLLGKATIFYCRHRTRAKLEQGLGFRDRDPCFLVGHLLHCAARVFLFPSRPP